MAIYDFICARCEYKFEFFKVRSDEIAECPKCGATGEKNLRKQISTGVSHSLKGHGWFKDGYRGKKK